MNFYKSLAISFITLSTNAIHLKSEADSVTIAPLVKPSVGRVILIESGIYAGGMIAVGSVWYSKFALSSWHWFNDSHEWFQMDKMGHAFSTYQGARVSYKIHRYFGFSEQKSIVWSSTASFLAISSVEIFDGFASEWGASWYDIAANALGAGLFAAQQAMWQRQIVHLKFSYHLTSLPQYRPELFGKNFGEKFLKDYNAQQYWLSINVKEIIPLDFIPAWINIALGYGASNMLSANTSQVILEGVTPYRRFFIGPDIDLSKLPVRNKFLKSSLEVLNMIKIPLPVIEFNPHRTTVRPLF